MGGMIIEDTGLANITDVSYNSSYPPRLELTKAYGGSAVSNVVYLSDSFTNATMSPQVFHEFTASTSAGFFPELLDVEHSGQVAPAGGST